MYPQARPCSWKPSRDPASDSPGPLSEASPGPLGWLLSSWPQPSLQQGYFWPGG